MKTNISIDLNEDDRNRLSNIYHNKLGKKLITRKELNALVNLFVQELLGGEVKDYKEVSQNIIEEGYRYYFNDVRVTPEEYQEGIHAWLEKKGAAK